MKPIKIVLTWIATTIVMVIAWIIGNIVGNAVTGSQPPPIPESSNTGLIFLLVCLFNGALITALIAMTRDFAGTRRRFALLVYVFAVQFFLPQLETYFFAQEIGIGYNQTTAILIAGAIVSLITLPASIGIYNKLIKSTTSTAPLQFSVAVNTKMFTTLGLLILIAYPFIYLTFGYYVAWQNESLRVFYTDSTEMATYGHQLGEAFRNGIYFFQILRGLIWIAITVPVAVMLRRNVYLQFITVGMLSALLPTSLLFIPNPYMPETIAMTHFVETSTSNFVWGCLMVWWVRNNIKAD